MSWVVLYVNNIVPVFTTSEFPLASTTSFGCTSLCFAAGTATLTIGGAMRSALTMLPLD
jgi:ABC-type transport system involved in cytochrome c biogenesis permease component